MNYLLPSIRYLVPVVALFLWANTAWGQCGVSTTGTPTVTPIPAPTTIVNNVTFDTRYTNASPVPVNCIGCTTAPGSYHTTITLTDNDPCYDSDGDGDPTNDNFTYTEAVALGLFPDGTTPGTIGTIDGTNLARMCPVDYTNGGAAGGGACVGGPNSDDLAVMATYTPTPPATCAAGCTDTDCDYTNGNGTVDFNVITTPNTGDIPVANLPASLGGVATQFFDVDFYLDQNCQAEVRLAGTGWMAATTCGCRYVNYYDRFGEFMGREDIISGVSSNPVPFILDGQNRTGASTPGFPKVGDYIFFQVDNGFACDSNTPNGTGGPCSMAINRSSVFAFRIRNIFDDAPPVIKGSFNVSNDYCAPNVVTFDNGPTDIVGDPRSDNNDTQTLITDNDPTAGIGTVAGYDASTPTTSTTMPRNDQVRALLCKEMRHGANTATGGVLPGNIFPHPEDFIYIYNYGNTDQTILDGTGFIDGTDPSDPTMGDIYNTNYTGTNDVFTDANGNLSTNNIQPFAPDGCGGGVTVDYSDGIDNTDRGNIYGLNTSNPSSSEDVSDGVFLDMTDEDNGAGGGTAGDGIINGTEDANANGILNTPGIDFGEGADGRFRECYSITRQWVATDDSMNDAMCNQKISVIEDYEGDVCQGTGGSIDVDEAGSPYFTDVVVGGTTVSVTPQPTDNLSCPNVPAANTNIYESAGFPTLFKYTNPFGPSFPDIIAPNYTTGQANAGNLQGTGTTSAGLIGVDQHYNFPVFVYDTDMTSYSCSQATTLDGFVPAGTDICGIQPMQELEPLYDYGLDGDFGDIGANIFISSSVACPFWDTGTGMYLNNWPIDNTGGLKDQASGTAPYILNDDKPNGFTPADCESYNYDILRRWVIEDNCGFKSIAQRIYRVRDIEAPDAALAGAVQVNGANHALSLTSNVYSSSAPGDTTNMKEFASVAPINIPFSTCTPVLTISTDYLDNCANDLYLTTTYDIEEIAGASTIMVISGVPYSGTFMTTTGQLAAGKDYIITLHSTDPCGNITDVEIAVQTAPTAMTGCSDTSPVNLTLSSGGTAQVNATQIMPTSSCIQTMLLNRCARPECVYMEMLVDGVVVSTGDIVQTTPSYDLNLIDLSQIPTYVFNCQTGSFNVTVNLYEAAPCVPANYNQPFNSSTQTATLIGTHTRVVNVSPSASGGVSVTATGVDATSTTATDGQINLSLSSSFPGELFTVSYIQFVGGVPGPTIVATTTATAPSYTITGLGTGIYQVFVTGNLSCGTTQVATSIGASTPLELKFVCPNPVVEGNVVNLQIAPTSNFINLTSIDFGVTLSSPAGATISSLVATSGFSATTGGFASGTHYFIGASNTTADVLWSTSNTNTENLTDCVPFITVVINIPPGSAPGTLTVTLDGGIDGVATATQNMGTVQPMVPLTFDPGTVPCNSTINPSGAVGVTAGGLITFMSVGNGVSNTSVLLQNITAGTSNTANTGAMPSTGAYNFTGISSGDDIKITPSRTNSATANYVNVTDAILLARYVSGIAPGFSTHLINTNPEIIAGDVDYDGDIDFIDVIRIRQSVVGFAAQQYIKTDWVFYPTTTTFPAIPFFFYSSPLMQCFSGILTSSTPNIDFVAVKVGDVNETATSFVTPGPVGVAARSQAAFQIEDQAIQAGQWVEVPIYAKDFVDLFAYQTNIQFDTDYLDFESVELGDVLPELSLEDFGTHLAEGGLIPTLWGDLENIDLEDGDKLFTLKFKANKTAKSLKGLIELVDTEEVLSNAYDGTLTPHQLTLDITAAASDFVLYPSTPNPFAEQTKISFDLPEASTVNLVVTDVTGRVVYRTQANMNAGYNEFFLNKSELAASGVYYYQVRAANYEASAKVILMD